MVWAAHPSRRETSYIRNDNRDSTRNYSDRFHDYIEDLGHLLNVMEIGKVTKFVCLSVCPEERHFDRLVDPVEMKILDQYRKLARDVEALVASKNRVQWSVVRSSGYREFRDEISEEESGDAGHKAERYEEWVDQIVRTMVDTLRSRVGEETLGTEVNSPNSEILRISNAEAAKPAYKETFSAMPKSSGTSFSFFTDIIASNPPPSKSPLQPSFSRADPILSPINPLNFPNHFSHQSSTFTSSMSKLLEDVRTGREQTTSRLHEEHKLNEALLRKREIARLEAQKKGLPPPGSDIQMLIRVGRPSKPQTSKPKIGNSLKRTAIHSHPLAGRSHGLQRDVVVTADTDAMKGDIERKSGVTQMDLNMDRSARIRDAWRRGDLRRVREALEDKREGLFETLADVLLDRSPATDQLTPQLVGQTSDINDGKSEWNPFPFERGIVTRRTGGRKG